MKREKKSINEVKQVICGFCGKVVKENDPTLVFESISGETYICYECVETMHMFFRERVAKMQKKAMKRMVSQSKLDMNQQITDMIKQKNHHLLH